LIDIVQVELPWLIRDLYALLDLEFAASAELNPDLNDTFSAQKAFGLLLLSIIVQELCVASSHVHVLLHVAKVHRLSVRSGQWPLHARFLLEILLLGGLGFIFLQERAKGRHDFVIIVSLIDLNSLSPSGGLLLLFKVLHLGVQGSHLIVDIGAFRPGRSNLRL